MKNIAAIILSFVLPFTAANASEPTDTVTIFMIGDSTMADKPLAKENQERGWGQMLPLYFEGAVKIDNHAVNGRSSKSFIDEGRWDKVRELMRPGDYLIIQFGHNDEKSHDPSRHTVAGGSFDDNLRKFVTEAKSKGANPILMNSIVRRNFPAPDGTTHAQTDDKQKDWKSAQTMPANEGDILVETHGAYLDSPRNVAKAEDVPFIDLNSATRELVQQLGPTLSKNLFMWIPAGKYEFCPAGKVDNTHLNILGGLLVSRLAATELAEKIPGLRRFIKPEIYNLNDNGDAR